MGTWVVVVVLVGAAAVANKRMTGFIEQNLQL